jgi:hypothetical protein
MENMNPDNKIEQTEEEKLTAQLAAIEARDRESAERDREIMEKLPAVRAALAAAEKTEATAGPAASGEPAPATPPGAGEPRPLVPPAFKTTESAEKKRRLAPLTEEKILQAEQEKSKKGKEAIPKKTAGEEVKDFVDEYDLGPLLPAEFEGLSDAQKLKITQDLKRRIVDIVKSDAQTQYSEWTKDFIKKQIKPSDSKIIRGLKTVFLSAGNAVMKEMDLKKTEGKVFRDLRETDEGKKLIAEDLKRLTQINERMDIEIDSDGKPLIVFIRTKDIKGITGREVLVCSNFNRKAQAFTGMPYEWGQEKNGKHRKVYEKAKSEYENARSEVLEIKASREKKEDKGEAVLEMLDYDSAIQMEQLLNTHPEFEKALSGFGESAGGKEMVKTAGNFLQTITGGKNLTNKLLTAGGFTARWLAKAAVLASVSGATVMSAVATPVIGGTVGYWRGKVRAKGTIEERGKGARHGLKDVSEQATNTVSAENLNKRLEFLIKKAADGRGDIWSIGNYKDESKRGKDSNIRDELKRRIEYTREKIESGLVNFGDAKTSLSNQFNLSNNLNKALVISSGLEESTRKDIDERLERFLAYKSTNINEAQKEYIGKQARRGMYMGAGFATAGYALRYLGEQMGWWGHAPSGAGVKAHVETGGKPPTTEPSEGFFKRTEKWFERFYNEHKIWGRRDIDLKGPKPPGLPSKDELSYDAKIRPIPHEVHDINLDAIIHKGQGIEHALIRQIEHNPKLVQELHFKGNINDAKAVHAFAQRQAHILATKMGYVSSNGQEIRVSGADKVAYEIDHDADGKIIINERTVADGKLFDTHHEGDTFEKGDQIQKEYEYKYAGHRGEPHHLTGIQHEAPVTRTPTPENPHFTPADVTHPQPPIPKGSTVDEITKNLHEQYERPASIVTSKGLGGNNTVFNTNPSGIRGEDLRTGSVVTSRGEGGVNTVYNTNPEGIRIGGGEHFQHFVGLSPEQNELLNHHPEFANNPFHLLPPRLMEVYDVHQKNLAHIFNQNNGMQMWNNVKGMKASELLDNKNPDPNNPLIPYLHNLQLVTKIKPQGGIFKRPETVNEFIARALQKAAKLGKLTQVQE